MSPAPQKVCIVCNHDCSTKPRTKDPQGRYTCKACADRLAARRAAPAAAAAAPADVPDDAAVMAALLKDAPAGALTENCPSCGSGLPPGAVICTICGYDKSTGRTAAVSITREAPALTGAAAVAVTVATAPVVWALAALGASVGGALGAAVWAGVAYGLHVEIGWIAIGVGAAAGIGAAVAAGKRAGPMTGLIAAAIAIAAVAGGKYAAASLVVDDVLKKEIRKAQSHRVTDDEVIGVIARDVAREQKEKGKRLDWPGGIEPEFPIEETEFPPPIWADARERFQALDEAGKDQWRSEVQERYRAGLQAAVADVKEAGFIESFGVHDLLWFGLAVVAAFGAGTGANTGQGGRD